MIRNTIRLLVQLGVLPLIFIGILFFISTVNSPRAYAYGFFLSGVVFDDINHNGAVDSDSGEWERGKAGRTVTLNTGQVATTNADGVYRFSDLTNGTYTVTLTIPSGYSATPPNPPPTPTNQAPVLGPIGNQTVREDESLQFTVTATDPDGNALTYTANNLPTGATFNSTTHVFYWTPGFNQAGNYPNIEFTVTDNGSPIGLDTELITISVGDVNRAPVFDPTGSQEVLENHALTFTVNATDPDGDTATLSATNLPTGASFDPQTGAFSWTPTLSQAGNYVVTFNATDDGAPVEIGHIDVPITVGDSPTPTEQAENIVDTVVTTYDFPTNIENSYLSNLKKVASFIEDGQINAARNQLNAFITKVNTDYAAGTITKAIRDNLVGLAQALLADLQP